MEEGTLASTQRRNPLKQQFADVILLHKKLQQVDEKLESRHAALSNKRVRGGCVEIEPGEGRNVAGDPADSC